MGYNIEISIDLLKHNSVSELKREISDLALDHQCNHYYYLYEMEGGCKIPRNHIVMVINFDDEEIFNCGNFLKIIKKKDLIIECIYEDDIACKLIFASKYYQTNMMLKENVVKYNQFKRERSLSENEKIILETFPK